MNSLRVSGILLVGLIVVLLYLAAPVPAGSANLVNDVTEHVAREK